MKTKQEIDLLYSMGVTKKAGWQKSNCPILAADYGDLEKAWGTTTRGMSEDERESLINTIRLAVEAQHLFRRASREAGDFVPQPKLIASWIRKKRWLDQIDSHSEIKKKEDRYCHCGELVHGNLNKCAYHYSMENGALVDELRQQYVKMGLKKRADENSKDYQIRMRNIIKTGICKIGK